ncbi:MAG: polysaccharide biosynthesis protein, partial [Alcaligenaceae bacterium]
MIEHSAQLLMRWPRPAKRLLAVAVDIALCVLCVWAALCLRHEQWISLRGAHWGAVWAAPALALPVFVVFGLYRAIFRYASGASARAVLQACLLFGMAYAVIFTVIGIPGVPRSIGVMVPLMVCLAIGGTRALARHWLGGTYGFMRRRHTLPQVFIYGAGQAGRQLAAALNRGQEMVVRGFVDDDLRLQGGIVEGARVRSPAWLMANAKEQAITDVLLALPSVSHSRRAEILNFLLPLHVHVRMLPSVDELAKGKVQMADLYEVRIEDLLGRDAVAPVDDLLHRNIRDQVVLVTGAGGSIGSELCRQIVQQQPKALLLVEWSEFALYAIHGELEKSMPDVKVVPLLASVSDEARMRDIMQAFRPATVYHAAAYKHVPLVEHNPAEGLHNNVQGTLTTARVA